MVSAGPLLTAGLLIARLASPGAQLVDRLAAVVGGEPIFLSDVREAVRLRLLDPASALAAVAADTAGPVEDQALARMIDRRLVLAEVARYSQAPPVAADVDEAVRRWAAAFPQAPQHDAAAVRAFLTDSLRIERYVDQRFTAAAQPTREEARAFYQANLASFARGEGVPQFESVEDQARRRLADERRVAMVREWLRGLRDRAQVKIYR